MISYSRYFGHSSLFFTIFALLALKYGFFIPFGIPTVLNHFDYALLIIASVCIAGAGLVMDWIFDSFALPKLAEKEDDQSRTLIENRSYLLFVSLNIVGVSLGFYLAYHTGKSTFAAFFILVSALYYLYASYLKRFAIIKNLIAALFAIFPLLIPVIFDLLPAITGENRTLQSTIFAVILDYCMLIFALGLLLSLVEECADLEKDRKKGRSTILVILGPALGTKLIAIAALIPVGMIFWYMYTYFFDNNKAMGYGLLLLIAPLLYFSMKCWQTKNIGQFTPLKNLLKTIHFFVLCTLLLYPWMVPHS